MVDVVIVGAGLFGQVIASTLRKAGQKVVLLDDARPGAGSPPAGCVIRPSWLAGKMPRAERDASLALLDELYGLQSVRFACSSALTGNARGYADCYRVETGRVLSPPTVFPGATVYEVANNYVSLSTDPPGGMHIDARHVVVATGVWARELCPWAPVVTPKWGYSFRGPVVLEPRIHLWAPYRQIVSFNMDDGQSWIGDGGAYNQLTDQRLLECMTRCAGQYPERPVLSPRSGARPVVKGLGSPAYCERGPDGVWCVTGGGKNGLAGAAWAALRLRERLT